MAQYFFLGVIVGVVGSYLWTNYRNKKIRTQSHLEDLEREQKEVNPHDAFRQQ